MFLPHIKAEAVASPELPFPYPTLYRFGSAAYDDPDVISFLPPASRTVRRRSSKGNIGLLICETRDSCNYFQRVTSAESQNASASAQLPLNPARTAICLAPVCMSFSVHSPILIRL